jgi:hypothetical protein
MKTQSQRTVQWLMLMQGLLQAFQRALQSEGRAMRGNGYEMIKRFEAQSDKDTKVVVSISARAIGDKVTYRLATQREHRISDGTVRRSPWLGMREMVAKAELEKQAMEYIVRETAKHATDGAAVSA